MVRIFDMSAGEEQLDLSMAAEQKSSVAIEQSVTDYHQQCQLRLLSVAESEEQRVPRPRPWLF